MNIWKLPPKGGGLVPDIGFVSPNGLVRNITRAAFYAVVHADVADRTDGFIIESWYTQCGAQLFVKFAQTFEVTRQSGKL